jgi:bifunctional non-homologous end joining protein LigD
MFPAVSPAVLRQIARPFDDPDWLYELKLDGFRALAFLEPSEAHLISRKGNKFRTFEPLCLCLARLGIKAILDGEIVCTGQDGRPLFYKLMRRHGTPSFYAFDVLWLDGQDLRELPLIKRKERLREILPDANEQIRYVPHFNSGCDLFAETCRRDLEGIVAKPRMSRYGDNWLKIKNRAYSQNEGRREMFERFQKAAESPRPGRSCPPEGAEG